MRNRDSKRAILWLPIVLALYFHYCETSQNIVFHIFVFLSFVEQLDTYIFVFSYFFSFVKDPNSAKL